MVEGKKTAMRRISRIELGSLQLPQKSSVLCIVYRLKKWVGVRKAKITTAEYMQQ